MAQGLDQARQQRELSKQRLAADAARVEARIRSELDWRARLRRDGPRLAALGAGAVILIGTIVLLRSRLRREPDAEVATPTSLDEVATELREMRRSLERRGGDGSAMWQKALLRAVAAAGAAGGTYAAKRLMDQQAGNGKGRAEATGAG